MASLSEVPSTIRSPETTPVPRRISSTSLPSPPAYVMRKGFPAAPKLEAIVDEIERYVLEAQDRECTTTEIGNLLMQRLRKLDKVAYVRFASVYRHFRDINEFMSELNDLLNPKE